MLPAYVRTRRDLLAYEWARIQAKNEGVRTDARYLLERVKELRDRPLPRLSPPPPAGLCIFDGKEATLEELLVPPSLGGLEIEENLVPVCDTCRKARKGKGLWEGVRERRGKIPRNVWIAYLQALHAIWIKQGTLETPLSLEEKTRWENLDVER